MSEQLRANSPPSGASRDPEPESGSRITRRDIGLFLGTVVLVGTIGGSLYTVLEGIRSDIGEVRSVVHENAQDLAVVQSEIKGLRRDIGRIEGDIDPQAIKKRPASPAMS
jgi:hypothetical protein